MWVYFTRDNSKLITGDMDGKVKMWDVYDDFKEKASILDKRWGNIS